MTQRSFLFLAGSLFSLGSGSEGVGTNTSVFSGPHSAGRLAYYHWKIWLASQEAILQKVPPVPFSLGGNLDRPMWHILLRITSIINVDESRQMVTIAASMDFSWHDPSLALDGDLVEAFTGGNSTLLPDYVMLPPQDL
ncbi:hypothetical protein ACOMHN_014684 [Nucella lapillus]